MSVFISYATEQAALVAEVRALFKRADIEAWEMSDAIKGGELWEREIRAGLQASDVIVVIVSTAAVASEWVYREIATAVDMRKRMIPLRTDDTMPGEVHMGFAGVQYIQATGCAGEWQAGLLRALKVEGGGDDRPATGHPVTTESSPRWAHVSEAQKAEAKRLGVPVAFEDDVGMRCVLIPAGSFQMGSPTDEILRDEGETQHKVAISQPFYLATTETTQASWERVMGLNPSDVKGAALPVTNVSWENCQSFVKRVKKLVAGGGYRLPTEAEWEYACRAGTKTRYWSGDDESDLVRVGWYSVNSLEEMQPVGKMPANPWGLHDMHGNVWEWCEDSWHDSYEGAPDDGSTWIDPESGVQVIRGGYWGMRGEGVRSASRSKRGARYCFDSVGFRAARSVTP